MMQHRRLGRTDISVSPICLGTMTWGQQNTEAEGHAQLDRAIGFGINFIDTAELYAIPPKAETHGSTETIIGSWLKSRGGRDRVILASKVVGRGNSPWFRPEGARTRLDRANITYAIEGSLRRLQTDYLDLYQLHWPDRRLQIFGEHGNAYRHASPDDMVPMAETLGVLAELITAGKIRHVGLSNETAWGTMRFLQASDAGSLPRMVSIQNAYNLLNRSFETGLAEIALNEDVGLLAYSPLGQGYLTGKYLNGARPAGARTTLFNRGSRYEKPGVDAAIQAYAGVAREMGISLTQLALAFVTSRPFVTSNIIGATTLAQLDENLASLEVTISPETETRLDALLQLHGSPAP